MASSSLRPALPGWTPFSWLPLTVVVSLLGSSSPDSPNWNQASRSHHDSLPLRGASNDSWGILRPVRRVVHCGNSLTLGALGCAFLFAPAGSGATASEMLWQVPIRTMSGTITLRIVPAPCMWLRVLGRYVMPDLAQKRVGPLSRCDDSKIGSPVPPTAQHCHLPNIHTSLSTHPRVCGVLESMLCICRGSASKFAGMCARNEQERRKAPIRELWPRDTRGWWDIERLPVPHLLVRHVFVAERPPSRDFRSFFAYKFML